MNVQQLIDDLQKIEDKTKDVYVWNGYNAGSMTRDFVVRENSDGSVDLE